MSSSDISSVHLSNPLVRKHLSRSFPSLAVRDFRLLLAGLLVSGTGGWVQRIAQDWLVLTLTDSPTAVGITTAFQFLPTLVLGLQAGLMADRFPKRTLLMATQVSMAAAAAALAGLTLAGRIEVWHVYLLALVLGVITAVDNPVRQSFVSEVVDGPYLPNAISLVSCTFQIGAMAGPVIGGVLMGSVGAGYAFAVNACSFLAPLLALSLMRGPGLQRHTAKGTARTRLPNPEDTMNPEDMVTSENTVRAAPSIREGLSYAARTSTVLWPVVMVGAFGFFTISLPVTLAAFAKDEFHSGATGLGILNGMVALGALAGALSTARRRRPLRLRTVGCAAWALATAMVVAALAPNQCVFIALLVLVGAANLGFLTSAQSLVQLAAADHLRGRVVGLYLLVFIGSGALGGPVVGLVAEHLGARTALFASGVVPALVTIVVCRHLARIASLRVGLRSFSVRVVRPSVMPRA